MLYVQLNSVSVTSSHFPNRMTFPLRGDFCVLVRKLMTTCSTKKYFVLHNHWTDCLVLSDRKLMAK